MTMVCMVNKIDLSSIDSLRAVGNLNNANGQPAITVELEDHPMIKPVPHSSPFRLYRRHGTLSVTDLVSPVW